MNRALAACFLSITSAVHAQELLPAERVIERLNEKAPAERPKDANDPAAALNKEIEAFGKAAPALPPRQAAEQWLALVDRSLKVQNTDESSDESSLNKAVKVLPPPASWDSIAELINARPAGDGRDRSRNAALKLFVQALVGDSQSQAKALAEFESTGGAGRGAVEHYVEQFRQALAKRIEDPAEQVEQIQRRIQELQISESGYERLELPDLVTTAGPEKARQLLEQAMGVQAQIEIEVGDETIALAQKIGVEKIVTMRIPQWGLVKTLGGVDLFEAIDRKFATDAVNSTTLPSTQSSPLSQLLGVSRKPRVIHNGMYDYQRRQAEMWYLLGLISAGRSEDATKVAVKLGEKDDSSVYVPYGAIEQLDRAGRSAQVQGFLHTLLNQHPEVPLWDQYVSLSARVGKNDQMLALVREVSHRPNLEPQAKLRVQQQLYRAYLAADEIEQGITTIQSALKDAPTASDAEWCGSLSVQLATIGHLLSRPELIEEGINTAKANLAKLTGDDNRYERQSLSRELARLLVKIDRKAEAAQLLTDSLVSEVRAADKQRNHWRSEERPESLIELTGVYHAAGRHADVLEMLLKIPNWKAADLSEILTETDGNGKPLGYMAAVALLETNRLDEARKVINALLDQKGGYDPAYELLLKVEAPDKLVARLDELFSRDQFEERPLIWKAKVLLDQKKLEEAERTARQAIAIDPSDGEQGRGDRMRVYAVLSDILAARGDAKQSGFFKEVVRAIRIAEDADQFYQAGMVTRGVKMYEEALKHFADAYCIQSRMAIQLADMGQYEAAEVHYRKAYELMPDSFGRMESHCFGCEGAFSGNRAQSIAERVFTRLLQANPLKPQVHYLLGYLRVSQGRYAEALPRFKEAVKLDQDYLSAWKQLESMKSRIHMPLADRDAAALNLLKLDPQRRHTHPDLDEVSDLRALYAGVEAALKFQAPVSENLLPLTASADAMKEEKDLEEHINIDQSDSMNSPGAQIAGNEAIAPIIGMLENLQE